LSEWLSRSAEGRSGSRAVSTAAAQRGRWGSIQEGPTLRLCILFLAVLLAVHVPRAYGQLIFGCDASLHGSRVVPPTNSPGGASFEFTFAACAGCYDCVTGSTVDSLAVIFRYQLLAGTPTGASLFAGEPGVNGVFLRRMASGYFASGDTLYVHIIPDECDDFTYGSTYVVIETDVYPSGEVRGQLRCHVSPVVEESWGFLRSLYR